jgi:dipeptidyl aminopeptidase/acylaminoacyl peptidase
MYRLAEVSPDGQHLLIERLQRPFSRLFTENRFPVDVEIADLSGKMQHTVAHQPLADQVPIEGARTGPRSYGWRPTEPATLVWAEALDGGDPKAQAPYRDRVLTLAAPFTQAPVELFKMEQRFSGIQWNRKGEPALVHDYDPDRRWRRSFAFDADQTPASLRLIWDLSASERYKDPGSPLMTQLPTGHAVMLDIDGCIYLSGSGASQEGDRPFLDRLNLRTLEAQRLFRCDRTSFETVLTMLDAAGKQIITRRETPSEPPNFMIRTLGDAIQNAQAGEAQLASSLRPVTTFPDPTPQLRAIGKQLVTLKRADGVQISMTVYLPPGYKPGTRLPTVLYAYPLEHTESSLASQVVGSSQRFTTISGASHVFYTLEGYAVLEPTMPIVGPTKTVYDTFVEQLVANARAAIDKAVEMGITDPNRVGVIGHSHGGLMTADLLAHCDLFRAGIARSGAHNKTLTAFGFQNEHRTLWEALDTYIKVSPLFYANKIKDPLLLIHGERDANPGTVPMQSERLYEAVRGNGGVARLVMLPLESHGYTARESVEHTLYEMITWFDRYVKDAKPRVASKE